MKIEQLQRELINLLRDNISNPCGYTGHWIFVGYPRTDAKMPRISLTLTSSPQRPVAIGAEINVSNTLGVMEETTFDIDIWVHRTNKTTGISPKRGGNALVAYLADQVVDVILEKRNFMRTTYDLLDMEKVGEVIHPYDEENELFRKTINLRVIHLRSYLET